MLFQWNELKNLTNVKKHGIRFEDAQKIFTQLTLTYFDGRGKDDEDRYVAIGLLGAKLLTVVFVERGNDIIRIISARKATKSEERRYERGY